MVDLCLNYRGAANSPLLSIPNSDIKRLSNRPFPWLRYVMFTICGARGDLFETLDADDPVDYNTSLDDLPAVIYYKPSEDCTFVDYEGLNDQITSTNQTLGRENFREVVLRRDGSCVITKQPAIDCDAVHLIPRSEGNEYIAKVVRLRSHLYSSPPSISGINDGQNGMLLGKDLHSRLSRGDVAFIKTPNYGLEPTDIKRVDLGPPCTNHITLHQLVKPESADPNRLALFLESQPHEDWVTPSALALGANFDAQFRGLQPESSQHPPLILDYVYGIAAIRSWGCRQGGEVHDIMRDYRRHNYTHIFSPQQTYDNDNDPHSNSASNDPNDGDYIPSQHSPSDNPSKDRAYRPPRASLRNGDIMAAVMTEMNLYFMSLHGITPEEAAISSEKRMREEQLMAEEASRSKVMEWRKTTAI